MIVFSLAIAMFDGNHQQAVELVERAMNVIGGRQRLESVRGMTFKIASHAMLVEQSERPMGPYLHVYSRGVQTIDFDKGEWTGELITSGLVYGPNEVTRKVAVDFRTGKGVSPLETWLFRRRIAFGPDRALLSAYHAADLQLEPTQTFNGVMHDIVRFRQGDSYVRLFLKRGSNAPSAVETTSRMPFPWLIWGDVKTTTRWGAWEAREFGIMEPGQWTTDANGITIDDVTVLSSELKLGPGSAAAPSFPELPKDDPKPLLARYKAVKVADGIMQYQGPFNTFVVDQPDGLVVIEPVMNSAFTAAFLDRLKTDFLGRKVKAVVATDDAWPHFGGIRTFVARGADLVVLDLNRPIVQRLCEASYASLPDELANRPMKPRFRLVGRSLSLGSGPNRMIFYPIAGQGSERMMMAYFPERRLLYGSDLLQKTSTGFFFPSYPKELAAAVKRENLDVETVFAEHLGPTPWKVVTDFVESIGRD